MFKKHTPTIKKQESEWKLRKALQATEKVNQKLRNGITLQIKHATGKTK